MRIHQRRHSTFWRRWLTRLLIARLRTKSVETRTYILQMLGKVGDESALPVILDAARDTNTTIRGFAISALADLGSIFWKNLEQKRAIDVLINALDDSEADIRAAAAMALVRFEDEPSIESALVAALNDEDISVRTQAVIGLGRLGSIQALPMLKRMITTESGEWMHRYINQSIRQIESSF